MVQIRGIIINPIYKSSCLGRIKNKIVMFCIIQVKIENHVVLRAGMFFEKSKKENETKLHNFTMKQLSIFLSPKEWFSNEKELYFEL